MSETARIFCVHSLQTQPRTPLFCDWEKVIPIKEPKKKNVSQTHGNTQPEFGTKVHQFSFKRIWSATLRHQRFLSLYLTQDTPVFLCSFLLTPQSIHCMLLSLHSFLSSYLVTSSIPLKVSINSPLFQLQKRKKRINLS